ncbi:MAG: hypothetical protein OSB10_05980 [Planctomycetota bacterium]|nr:hypothetical protein [Planctomycetota bacterium]
MQNSPLLEMHHARSARIASTPAGDTLLTYGDVPGEYEAATKGALLFDETARGLIHVTGSDAKDFLHRLLTNHVKSLPSGNEAAPGLGNANLLLTGKGKIAEQFHLAQDGKGGYLLSTEPGRALPLMTALDMYLFVDDVQLTDQSQMHSPLSIVGPDAQGIVEQCLGLTVPSDAAPYTPLFGALAGESVRVTPMSRAGCDGFLLESSPAQVAALWDALLAAGAKTGGLAIHDILRVEACVGKFGVDVDDSIYPQEARLEPAFSLDKGCYIGQEVVAKIDTYGGLNKRLMLLRVDHDNPVAAGTRLERFDEKRDAWRDLGVVTSWGYSFAIDGGCVLAYVKRRHQDVGTEFRLGELPDGEDNRETARIVDLPRE